MRPVNRRWSVTTPFGKPGAWLAGYHTGDDYAVPEKTRVRATKGGRLEKVGVDPAYGIYIVLRSWHRGRVVQHWYCHLSSYRSGLFGRKIEAGEVIAYSGNTGNSTGPHLHYEERIAPFGYWQHRKPQLQDWKPWRKRAVVGGD